MMLYLNSLMGRLSVASGFKVGSFTLVYGKGKQMPKTMRDRIEAKLGRWVVGKNIPDSVMQEIAEVDQAMGKNMTGRPLPFRKMEAEAAKGILDERPEHMFSPEAMVRTGWTPFQEFWFKQGWSRIIFHNCKDGVRPYICGDTIDFAGCKVCEKLMPPEVWAARELLRGDADN